MSGRTKKILSLFAACIAVISCAAKPCYADETKTVRVGWYESGRETEIGPEEEAHGYDYEYLQALSQYTGWSYEYVVGSWDECLLWLEEGKIDLLGFVQKSGDREEKFGYPSLPMAITGGYLVTGSESGLATSGSDNLDGISVGISKGNAYNEEFEEYRLEHGFGVTYVEYDTLPEIPAALARGEIDAAVVAEEDKTAEERIIIDFTSCDQYFVTDINNQELLRELDRAMIMLNTYCPYFNSDLHQKYFSVNADGKPVFTSEELEFIKNNPNIPVLYDSGWQPIEYWDEKEETYKGISPDLFKLLSEKCGINFVYEGATSGEILGSLQAGGQENVLTTISYDYGWAQEHDVYITQPFITSGAVRLGRNLSSKDAVVAIDERGFFSYLLQDEYEGMSTRIYSTPEERLEAIRKGEADYTFMTEDQANYYLSIPKYSEFETEPLLGYEQSICVSVKRESPPELMSVISKSLASVTHDEMTAIVRNNTINAYKLTAEDYLYKYSGHIIICAAIVLIIVAAFIAVTSIKNRSAARIKKAYVQKEEALVTAEKASAAKGNFMSRMSHEIRTPLNAVIGYNTIARNELSGAGTDEERRQAEMKVLDCLTKSDIASRHLLTIINDVLDMSAIESGRIEVVHERFDFKGLITSLTSIFYSQARSKGVDFDVVFDTLTEEWFLGDQMRTNQILTNLLSNAVKFTSEGGTVKLKICQPEAETNACHIHFEVEDTGIGMTEEYLSHIWTPFEQADSSISRRFGGTGLGLSITKNLVDLMGGTISVESQSGIGTKFSVDLTFEKAQQPENTGIYDFSEINALVVDDDVSTCDYMRLLFNRSGAKCAAVNSGEEALEAMKAAAEEKEPYTICLVDWRMPKMDGIETIRRIREIAGTKLPIIVLTAYDYSELADRAAEMGINRFLSKPLFQSSVFDLLANVCGKQVPAEAEKEENYDFSGARVILAEDNAMNMEIAKNLMRSVGLEVESAWNGREAVELFEKSEPGRYMAILMDVHMPVMDGYEATRTIRSSAHREAKTIPIIAMTADAFAENVAEAFEAGMNDHIPKPIDVDLLFEKLSALKKK